MSIIARFFTSPFCKVDNLGATVSFSLEMPVNVEFYLFLFKEQTRYFHRWLQSYFWIFLSVQSFFSWREPFKTHTYSWPRYPCLSIRIFFIIINRSFNSACTKICIVMLYNWNLKLRVSQISFFCLFKIRVLLSNNILIRCNRFRCTYTDA